MGFPNEIHGSWGDEKVASTTKKNPLGARMILPDGRVFRYSKAGEELGPGKVCMQAAGVANHDMDLVTTAAAVGAGTVTVTLGATAATKDQYADGYLYVNSTAGYGHIYRIASNPATAKSTAMVVTLENGDEIAVALTASSETGLMANPYSAVEVMDENDVDGRPLGVAATLIASGSYGWLQTWGEACVLVEEGVAACVLGQAVAMGAAVDGAVELAAGDVIPYIGILALIATAAADYGVVYLTISP